MRGEADKKDNARRIEKSDGLTELKDSDKSGTFVAGGAELEILIFDCPITSANTAGIT